MSIASALNRNDYTGNGSVATYSYSYKISDQSHLLVKKRDLAGVETALVLTTDYTVAGVGVSGGGSITLVAGNLTTGYHLTIRHVVPLVQNTDIRNQGPFLPEIHEDAFDYLTSIDQQQQDLIDRSLKMPETIAPSVFDPTFPAALSGAASTSLVTNPAGTGFAAGPTADQISTAQASGTAAAASAVAAAASAASAAANAAAIAASVWRDVVYITFADSPYAITAAHSGKLISVNSAAGAVVITMPQISSLALPFNVAAKLTVGPNSLTINRTGTDTINLATSKVISSAGAGTFLIADTDLAPDDWATVDIDSIDARLTTKGDLLTRTAVGVTRFAVGADTYIPVADSTQAAGIKWAPAGTLVIKRTAVNYTVLITDDVVFCTAGLTLTMYAASTGTKAVQIYNESTNAAVTINRAGSDTINFDTTQLLPPASGVMLTPDPTGNYFGVS